MHPTLFIRACMYVFCWTRYLQIFLGVQSDSQEEGACIGEEVTAHSTEKEHILTASPAHALSVLFILTTRSSLCALPHVWFKYCQAYIGSLLPPMHGHTRTAPRPLSSPLAPTNTQTTPHTNMSSNATRLSFTPAAAAGGAG